MGTLRAHVLAIVASLAVVGCDSLTGTRPQGAECHGYPPRLDTLTVFVGPSGMVDSVRAEVDVYAHVCGAVRMTPPRIVPDTVRTP